MKARRTFVEKHFARGAWERVLAVQPADDLRSAQGVLTPSAWFPFEMGERLDKAIAEVLGGGKTEIFEQIGAQSAHENLAGIHRPFLQPGNPEKFLEKTGAIYAFYYDTGRREFQPLGSQEGIRTTDDAETCSAADCLTVIGWHKEALRLCGADRVEMHETECRAAGSAVCRSRIRRTLKGGMGPA